MTRISTTKKLATTACVSLLALAGCNRGTESDLQSIVGVNARGKEVAMSLVPVRNYTKAKLDVGDNAAKQAAAMIKTRLFALVECEGVKHADGQTMSAAELMAAVEIRAAADDLYVDKERYLLTSYADDRLAEYGYRDRKLVHMPCSVVGERLVSWNVLADISVRAGGLAAQLPASGEERTRTEAIYRLGQALFLAARGSYTMDPRQDFFPRVPAIIDMVSEQTGSETTGPRMIARLRQADLFFNACDSRSTSATSIPYAQDLRKASYTCVPAGRQGFFNYRAGGDSGAGYEDVKKLLVAEISGTHKVVFGGSGNDPLLADLWDLITSNRRYDSHGGRKSQIGKFLATGKGFDFAAEFKVGKGVEASLDATPRKDLEKPTAPLALALPAVLFDKKDFTTADRQVTIRRAGEKPVGRRSIFDGGTNSTAVSRAANFATRLGSVKAEMGAGADVNSRELIDAAGRAMVFLRAK